MSPPTNRASGSIDCNGNEIPDDCDIAVGTNLDVDGDGVPDDCHCFADLDGSGTVDVVDLLAMLGAWGSCAGCAEDFDGSGSVQTTDLLMLLATWGQCP